MKNRAVFLDRDGTLNVDPGYLRDASNLELYPGVAEALQRLSDAGFKLVIVSNQSGVGRGIIPAEVMPSINSRLDELIAPAKIDLFQLCFHHPEAGCDCRKPKPKLLTDAAEILDLDLASSYMVGDRIVDILAGRGAGCRASILLLTGEGASARAEIDRVSRLSSKDAAKYEPDFTAETLTAAVDWILGSGNAGP